MSRWRRGHITWHWLEVAVKKGNERTLIHRAPAAGLGLKPVSMAIGATVTNPPLLRENMSCAKWLKSLNSLKWRFTLIHRPPYLPCPPLPLPHSARTWTERGSRAPPRPWDPRCFFGLSVWVCTCGLQGSDCKSARCLGSLCKSRGVYLRGYLQHAARSAEDESSADYIRSRRAPDELLEENVRGGSRTLPSASQLYWFSVTLFPNRRHSAARETVNLTPAVAAARGSANSHPDQREEAALFCCCDLFPFARFVCRGGENVTRLGVPAKKTQKKNLWTKTERDTQTGSQTCY